ncbi:MAG TPA: PaaI family thioesterase [Burkholderiaceae bacterium]|nr:PaaI family thioesterase [Burkholderiaceae bacterium]
MNSSSIPGAPAPGPADGDSAERWLADEAERRGRSGPAGVAALDDLRSRSGIEFLRALMNGELPSPPIGHTVGFVLIAVDPGRVVFQGTPGREHYNPIGTIHGGWIATLLDSAVGCAVHSTLPAGRGYTTLELKVNYVKAVSDRTGPLRAIGTVISAGRQAGTAEGRLVDAAGRLYAFATTTCLIFDL